MDWRKMISSDIKARLKVEVTSYYADPQIVHGKVSPANQKIADKYYRKRAVYAGEDLEKVKREFIEEITRTIRSLNVSEISRVLSSLGSNRPVKRYKLWIVTQIT